MNINPHDYALSFSDVPKPLVVDEDPVTENWPLPPAKAWQPRGPSLWEKARQFFREVGDAIDETFNFDL
jgi:hypothetical protein